MKNVIIQINEDNKTFLRFDSEEYTFNNENENNLNNYDYDVLINIKNFLNNLDNKKEQIFINDNKKFIFNIYKLNDKEFIQLNEFLECEYKNYITYNFCGMARHNSIIEISSNKLLNENDIKNHIINTGSVMFKRRNYIDRIYFLNLKLNQKKIS